MGTWGTDILEDDFACDVHQDFMEAYDSGKEFRAIRTQLENRYARAISDSDDGPVFWLALAQAQWECGFLDGDLRLKVNEIVERGLGLERWREGTAPDLSERCAALERFCGLLKTENTPPRKRQKREVFPPVFSAGDCLAIKLPSGEFGAALVLATKHTSPEYGQDLVGLLDYRAKTSPSLMVFESRKWLIKKKSSLWFNEKYLIWLFASGFSSCSSSVEKIGSVKLHWSDPKTSKTSCPNWRSVVVHIEKGIPKP